MCSFYSDPEMEDSTMAKKPVHGIRLGRVKAAIWENDSQNGPLYNVTFSRLYKDEDDQWKDSTSFGRDDLLVLAKVADIAHTWIFQQQQEDSNGSKGKNKSKPDEDF